jgi:hypothetical protein
MPLWHGAQLKHRDNFTFKIKGIPEKLVKHVPKDFHIFYSSPNVIRLVKSRMRWGRHAVAWEVRNAYSILVWKP